jgi:hypothetical protein
MARSAKLVWNRRLLELNDKHFVILLEGVIRAEMIGEILNEK